MRHDTVPYGMVQYGTTVRLSTKMYTVRYGLAPKRYGTGQYRMVWYGAVRYDTEKYASMRYRKVRTRLCGTRKQGTV